MTKIQTSTLANSEVISGILLMVSFALAIFTANIESLSVLYEKLVVFPITFGYGDFIYQAPLIDLVNDGLMTLFFLIIGLELKYHLVFGEFKKSKSLVLPTFAAVGGIVIPAAIYLIFNYNLSSINAWAIPIATDTAFLLGILSFFGKLISSKLRAFIIGFSLIDDALALLILAVFYSKSSSGIAIIASIVLIVLLLTLNRLKVKNCSYYLLIGIALWIAMVQAGVHGTLSGVILALTIPVQIDGKLNSSFHTLESILRPIVYFFILPVFAFVNSGINFSSFSAEILMSGISLGIILGLFLGKQLGIFFFSYVAVKKKWASLPQHVDWMKFYAISVLGGIGFTLSLFIGELSFPSQLADREAMRVGVIIGSLLSAVLGAAILLYVKIKSTKK
jgi:NhaA family Na+:H+ antiporter